MTGSVFVHFMRNRDHLSIIVKMGCATRAVVFFCCTNHMFSRFFCLSVCYQTVYLLVELEEKGESQKLLFSDTFVAAQTFSVDELLVTRLALQWWEESHTQPIGLCRQTVQKSSVDRRHADLHRFGLGHICSSTASSGCCGSTTSSHA